MSAEDVREMHKPVGREMYPADCSTGDCEHDGLRGCELEDVTVCEHCFETALASEWARSEDTTPIYTWPCPTIKALDKPAVQMNGDGWSSDDYDGWQDAPRPDSTSPATVPSSRQDSICCGSRSTRMGAAT